MATSAFEDDDVEELDEVHEDRAASDDRRSGAGEGRPSVEVDPEDPMARLAGARRVYIVPELRLMYMSLAKNACTSIKWLMAELAREDLEALVPTLGNHPNREAGVHNRAAWSRAKRLADMGEAGRRAMHPDNGWMIFSVVRDPRVRLFSAWQSKLLLRNPKYAAHADRAWAPRVPRRPSDVVEDFAAFVDALRTQRTDVVPPSDTHFRSQATLLAEHRVPYSHLYDVSELDTMLADLTAHVRPLGWSGELVLGTSNDTPLPATAAVFADGVREAIEEIYADDFARFGDRWDFARIEARPMTWTDQSFDHVRSLIDTHERISDLTTMARTLKRDNAELTSRVERLTRQLARAQRTPSTEEPSRRSSAGSPAGSAAGPSGLLSRLRPRSSR